MNDVKRGMNRAEGKLNLSTFKTQGVFLPASYLIENRPLKRSCHSELLLVGLANGNDSRSIDIEFHLMAGDLFINIAGIYFKQIQLVFLRSHEQILEKLE